ncbi:hypothetical protein BC629DRAFT_1507044 [Irpex lacteus]|nr:hypothetical protein BC629DRAFT_1507044 [Irpex lacteus]
MKMWLQHLLLSVLLSLQRCRLLLNCNLLYFLLFPFLSLSRSPFFLAHPYFRSTSTGTRQRNCRCQSTVYRQHGCRR